MTSTLRSRVREVVSNEILDAAELVLAEQTILALSSTPMTAIADKAGVSVGSLYNYFRDKDELIKTLLMTRCEQFYVLTSSTIAANAAASFQVQLEATVRIVMGFYDKHRNFFCILFASVQPEVGLSEQRTPWLKFIQILRPLMERGVADGDLTPVNVDLYPSMLAGVMHSVMLERLDDKHRSFIDDAPKVIDLFLNGSSTKRRAPSARKPGRGPSERAASRSPRL